jgi:predicted house-cleaning noncanonical NTP pyrophosphatase (MazG superfamily)
MFIPLSVILGVIMWLFTTWVKWRIASNYDFKTKLDDKLLQEIRRGTMTEDRIQEVETLYIYVMIKISKKLLITITTVY